MGILSLTQEIPNLMSTLTLLHHTWFLWQNLFYNILIKNPIMPSPSKESCAFVWGLFLLLLHLGNSRAELHGSLRQDSWLAKTQLKRHQSQQELLTDTTRKCQVSLVPHRQRIQVAHHFKVQVGKPKKSRDSTEEMKDLKLLITSRNNFGDCSWWHFKIKTIKIKLN